MTDDALAEIRALRERLAHLEKLATERSSAVSINHTSDVSIHEERRRQRDRASTYRPDPILERLHGLAAKAEGGNQVAAAELAAMAPSVRLALGFYLNSRAAAVELGLADERTGELR